VAQLVPDPGEESKEDDEFEYNEFDLKNAVTERFKRVGMARHTISFPAERDSSDSVIYYSPSRRALLGEAR